MATPHSLLVSKGQSSLCGAHVKLDPSSRPGGITSPAVSSSSSIVGRTGGSQFTLVFCTLLIILKLPCSHVQPPPRKALKKSPQKHQSFVLRAVRLADHDSNNSIYRHSSRLRFYPVQSSNPRTVCSSPILPSFFSANALAGPPPFHQLVLEIYRSFLHLQIFYPGVRGTVNQVPSPSIQVLTVSQIAFHVTAWYTSRYPISPLPIPISVGFVMRA